MPLDMDSSFTEIYSRKQNSMVFKYYVKDKKLIAAVINGDDIQQLPIDDSIPLEFQTDLNEEKITRLKAVFEQCYFGILGGKVLIHARGLGGWGDYQHKGYKERGWFNPVTGAQNTTTTSFIPAGGTYVWVRDIFEFANGGLNAAFTGDPRHGSNFQRAKNIADACIAIDINRATNSTINFTPEAQSWHFNTNADPAAPGTCPGGSVNDSRIQHAVACLGAAINNGGEVLLGYALHALQDVFAHTDAFVKRCTVTAQPGFYFYAHVFLKHGGINWTPSSVDIRQSLASDDPFCIDPALYSFGTLVTADQGGRYPLSQRYSDTKTASYILLHVYQLCTGYVPANPDPIQQMIDSRITQSLTQPAAPAVNFLNRGTHGILGFIDALIAGLPGFNLAPPVLFNVNAFLTTLKNHFLAIPGFYNGANIIGLSGIAPLGQITVALSMQKLIELQDSLKGMTTKTNVQVGTYQHPVHKIGGCSIQ